jgi:hypothetical protein
MWWWIRMSATYKRRSEQHWCTRRSHHGNISPLFAQIRLLGRQFFILHLYRHPCSSFISLSLSLSLSHFRTILSSSLHSLISVSLLSLRFSVILFFNHIFLYPSSLSLIWYSLISLSMHLQWSHAFASQAYIIKMLWQFYTALYI